MKPTYSDLLSSYATAINEALAEEFETIQPYQETPASGDLYAIYVATRWQRTDQNFIVIPGEVRLVKGYDTYTELSEDCLPLASWLEHSIAGLKTMLVEKRPKLYGLMSFYQGSGEADSYPLAIEMTASARLANSEQKAPWQLTMSAPVTLALSIQQCF